MLQNFNASTVPMEQPYWRGSTVLDDARDLIGRYPNLSEIELARLINLYRELSALEMAIMLADTKLAPSLDRFSSDHRSKIRTPFRQYAALVGYAAMGIAVAAWAIAS